MSPAKESCIRCNPCIARDVKTLVELSFAPYGLSSSTRRGTNQTVSKQWSIKMFCLADKNAIRVPCMPTSRDLLIEAGLGPKTFSVPYHLL